MNRAFMPTSWLALSLFLSLALPVQADNGDPSTRSDPVPPPYASPANGAVSQPLKQDKLEMVLTLIPAQPRSGDLVRASLRIHDPEQDRDFQGAVKVSVLDDGGKEISTCQALNDAGEACTLQILPHGGAYKIRFEFDAEIPAWGPSRGKFPAATNPPLSASSPAKGAVECEVTLGGADAQLPMPLLIGGGVLLALAALVFLRRRESSS